ncbi:MAG: DEAD/DEAH box helicase, partial [Prolixibacteraceae bacterium]|nr:DEAD/DEAH box helicase [Prolixibacteraceae bacterium]
MNLEFIIALADHRYLGKVLIPYLIKDIGAFKTIHAHVLSSEFEKCDHIFSEPEKDLVRIIEKYSDESLVRKFSRSENVSAFFNSLEEKFFKDCVSPFIDKQIHECIRIIRGSKIRLFRKSDKYSNLYDEDEIQISVLNAEAVYCFEKLENETRYSLQIFQEEEEIKVLNRNVEIITNEPCILHHGNKLYVFNSLNAKRLTPFFTKEFVSIPSAVEEKYYKTFILNAVKEDARIIAKGFSIIEEDATLKAVLSLEKNLKYEPVLVLRFYYNNEEFLPQSARQFIVSFLKENNRIAFHRIRRDFEREQGMVNYLEALGLISENGAFTPKGFQMLEKSNALYNLIIWLNDHKKQLTEKGIEVVQQKLEKKYFTGKQELNVKLVGVSDWFDIYAVVHFGDFEIPFIKLKKYILNDIREFELPSGEIAILPEEWFVEYKQILPFSQSKGNLLKLSKHHFPVIKKTIKEVDRDVIRKLEKISNNSEKIEIPETLNAGLRPYQHEGFNWLYRLYLNDFGGCLADDMGLGKTLQAITLLLKLKRLKNMNYTPGSGNNQNQLSLFQENENQVFQPASIIVLPTSLVYNWENELNKFSPSLKVIRYTGSQRRKDVNLKEAIKYYDVVLTTYGTVRNDIDLLSELEFFYVIIDESQYIKNPASKIYKAILKLKSRNRLVLTGTPIENSLMDLWSQLNFLNRGMLGNQAYFQRYFITPIEKNNDVEVNEKLQLMIRPFILRRKKEEVAKDLPPLMEQVRYCSMEKNQQKIYEKEKSVIRNAILENIEKHGIEKSSIVVLQGLAKLRQLANHPSMVNNDYIEESGKFSEIFSALDNLMAENHKVLIFSSFVKHLDLLKSRIEENEWKYSMLTGQTLNREKVINDFQEDEENRIFLISLKAGGVGLNLVEADYVFIIDPWWNPAAEMQAINRAHRIGQDKHVFVYRFITKNSIEEKIQQLQVKKSLLAEKFINSNNPFKEITKE